MQKAIFLILESWTKWIFYIGFDLDIVYWIWFHHYLYKCIAKCNKYTMANDVYDATRSIEWTVIQRRNWWYAFCHDCFSFIRHFEIDRAQWLTRFCMGTYKRVGKRNSGIFPNSKLGRVMYWRACSHFYSLFYDWTWVRRRLGDIHLCLIRNKNIFNCYTVV